VRLANVLLSSPDPEAAAAAAQKAAEWLGERLDEGVELVGPAPAPIERLHGRWRWHFLLRARSIRALTSACRTLVEGFTPPGADVRLALDRDPVALL
jgi:primosomal protein N' (replication factor Y)